MQTRRPHFLTTGKRSTRPTHVIFVDTETKDTLISPTERKLTLKLGWACYIQYQDTGVTRLPKWIYFEDSDSFWDFVQSHCYPKSRLYIVGHNIGFDFRILNGFQNVDKHDWDLLFEWNKGLVTLFKYKDDTTTIEILSTTNFFPIPLSKLGELVGLPKLDVSFDSVSLESLSAYCKRDVEIIIKAWNMWIAFLDKHNLGSFKHTLASQAFTSYKYRFMSKAIHIHDNMDVCKLERKAYKGGRTECFKVGKMNEDMFYYVDVNSMYSHQMMTQKYPTGFCGYKSKPSLSLLKKKLERYQIIARVIIKTEFPVFPIRHNNVNIYPVGQFETTLTTPELLFCLKRCSIIEILEMSWYYSDYIFIDYTSYFGQLKETYSQQDNHTFRQISKLFSNSLYGKFGQKDEKDSLKPRINPNAQNIERLSPLLVGYNYKVPKRSQSVNLGQIDSQSGIVSRPMSWIDSDVVLDDSQESYDSFPAIPAHVTAYARMYLWMLIEKAGKENCYYCDTDSLIVNSTGYENLLPLMDDHKQGYLKVELSAPTLTIFAPKDYTIGGRVRRKGIKKGAIEIAPGIFEQNQFLGIAGARRIAQDDLVTIKTVTKEVHRKIKTGNVQKDGWVTPFRFPL